MEMVDILWFLRVDAYLIDVYEISRAGFAVVSAVRECFAPLRHTIPGEQAAMHPACRDRTSLPIILQHQGHSRSCVGFARMRGAGAETAETAAAQGALVLRDTEDMNPGMIRCLRAEELNGRQYQLVVVRDDGRRVISLDEYKTLSHRDPEPQARFNEEGRWEYLQEDFRLKFQS